MLAKALQGAAVAAQPGAYIEDVFSTYLYTGNGSVQTINNGIALGSAYGGSVYFDGTNDYLTVANNTALQMGTGDFTIEFWWYPISITTPAYQTPFDKGYNLTGGLLLQTGNGDGKILVITNSATAITASTAVTVGSWNHMALVRNGTTLTLYLNGASVGSATNSANLNSTSAVGIGANAVGGAGAGAYPINGYMSNVRVVKGTAVYTSAFTPPTSPLTAITNTQLLTCQSPSPTTDYSSNAFTITVTNAIAQNGGGPFTDSTANKGGLVWMKGRSGATDHALYDTSRGATFDLVSNTTAAQTTQSTGLTAFNSTGFSIGALAKLNTSAATYVSWTFRKQAKFFDVVTYTGNGVAGRTISHNLGSVPGCIIVKNLTTGGTGWVTYHRSLGNTKILELNTTAAAQVQNEWNNTDPTSTVFSVYSGYGTNFNGDSYVAYLFAHDAGGFGAAGTDNVISCGTFTTNGSGQASVTLGYEPQWVLIKNTQSVQDWYLLDTMRGYDQTGAKYLIPNLSNAEASSANFGVINATGFSGGAWTANNTHIYIAIRRGPMRTPTSGTSVFTPTIFASSGSGVVTGPTPTDTSFLRAAYTGTNSWRSVDRLRGNDLALYPNLTNAEATEAYYKFDTQSGLRLTSFPVNDSIFYNFRRAPGFFDVVCYTGNGSTTTQSHNLGVTPELMIVRPRSTTAAWRTYVASLGPTWQLALNETSAAENINSWNSTAPTASVFSVSGALISNGTTYVAYLFATVAGVSKVGSYTGNGSSQTINCGFAAGARFILIKRTNSTGDWYVWDTARGIVSGNDPHLSLNTTAAEVTTDDTIDPDNSGFIVNQVAATNVNDAPGFTWVSRTIGFSTSNVNAALFANNLYVIGGSLGNLATSTDAVTWTARTSGFGSNNIRGLAYGNGIFVAVGDAGTLTTSTNGTTWTARTSSFGTTPIYSVCFGNGLFVAVGNTGTLATSSDGINWTQQTSGFGTSNIRGVVYDSGKYVAVGDSGKITTSTDGVSWTAQTSGVATLLNAVTAGGGLFVAVGNSGVLLTSPDAVTWTSRTSGFSTNAINSTFYANGLYIIGGSNALLRTSPDAINWTTRSLVSFSTNAVQALAYGSSGFVAGGSGGVLNSSDAKYIYLAIA